MSQPQQSNLHARAGARSARHYILVNRCVKLLQEERHFSGGLRRLVAEMARTRKQAIHYTRLAQTEAAVA
jgi:hypothetical protein